MIKQGFGKTLSDIDFAALKKGKHQGFIKAYKMYADSVYSLAVHIIKNHDLASDMLQQVFESLLNKSSSLQSAETLGAWLKQCTVNACMAHFRKEKQHNVYLEKSQQPFDGQVEREQEPSDNTSTETDAKEINSLLKKLPATPRSIVYLHSVQGLKHNEIAPSLGIKESNSRQLYSRALKQLKYWLAKER